MARSRNIKPGFFKNEVLAELSFEYRLLFIGLWTYADRAGRLEFRPKKIKAELFPYDKINIENGIQELAKFGFLIIYDVENVTYCQIVNWDKHQSPHHKEISTEIPFHQEKYFKNFNKNNELSMHDSSMTQACVKHDSSITLLDPLIPDSLNLIPDSGLLIPELKALSDKSDRAQFLVDAKIVLAFLNQLTGRSYREIDTNLNMIVSRLKSGVTLQECKTVIARKWNDWKDNHEMEIYLRPKTLFNRTNFEQYLGQIKVKEENEE